MIYAVTTGPIFLIFNILFYHIIYMRNSKYLLNPIIISRVVTDRSDLVFFEFFAKKKVKSLRDQLHVR
jgi:hypothetical protein